MTRLVTTRGKAGKARRRKNKGRQTTRLDSASSLQKPTRERTDEFADLRKQLAEALEQQTATSEVLKVISSSPGELEPVFHAMLANATRICEAKFGSMLLREGDAYRHVALHNAPPKFEEFCKTRRS